MGRPQRLDYDVNSMDASEPPVPAQEKASIEHTAEQYSDQRLIEGLTSGQLGALRAIYQRYARLVYTLAYRVLHSSEEAEEVTQDVFLTLWEKGGYHSERGGLSGYLTTMARSRAIDRVRSRNAHSRRLQRWHVMTQAIAPSTPLDVASLTERTHDVRQALVDLSQEERQILEISYYDGLSQSEIAKKLDIPLGTVKTRARRALKKLRYVLKDSR